MFCLFVWREDVQCFVSMVTPISSQTAWVFLMTSQIQMWVKLLQWRSKSWASGWSWKCLSRFVKFLWCIFEFTEGIFIENNINNQTKVKQKLKENQNKIKTYTKNAVNKCFYIFPWERVRTLKNNNNKTIICPFIIWSLFWSCVCDLDPPEGPGSSLRSPVSWKNTFLKWASREK